MRKSTLVAVIACLFATVSSASASTIRFSTDEELIAMSERVVRARPVARRAVWGGPQGRTIYTVTTLEVLEDFTGATDPQIEVWELGGVIGNQFMYVGGAVEYALGEEVLVLLGRGPNGLRSVAMNFSKFEVQRTRGTEGMLRRNMADTVVVGGQAPVRDRSVDEFRRLTERVKGVRAWRPAVAESRTITVEQGFTTLSDLRWTEADTGRPVRWFKNSAAPPPLTSGDAVSEIMTSLAAWTNPASASIILQYAGTTSATEETIADGNGVIMFEDPYNEIHDNVLAVGGGFGFSGGGGSFNGRTWNRFTVGYVIFQNAADLSATFRGSLGFTRVLTHEIGHAIGLGHSDRGEVNIMYPSCCSGSTPVPPNLGPDDLAGLNFIYPSGVSSCTYSINPTSASFPPPGGSGSVGVTTQAGCAWSAVSNSSFLSLTSNVNGSGSGSVSYSVVQNTSSSARSGTLTIAGQSFVVNQAAGCTYALSPAGATAFPGGGPGTLTVSTQAGCSWMATSNNPSVIAISAPTGIVTGSGAVTYTVAANGPSFRSASMSIAGQTFVVHQFGAGPLMSLNRSNLVFGATTSGGAFVTQTQAQTFRLTQGGPAGTVTWTASSNQPWLSVSPTSGVGPATFTVSVAPGVTVPPAGVLSGLILVNLVGAGNVAGPLPVTLRTYENGASAAPFGSFDSPANNAAGVTGSLPVTGWALDDVQVENVAIYRDAVAGEAAGLKFIGQAVLVDGARTDLIGTYAGLPLNTRGGWGYMLLTNMLPDRGNGTFVLHAYATDREGRQTLLGSKTITASNATSSKPFGAIDTPAQGATISGTAYNNFGWVLSPGTSRADGPGGGSVTVFIDGAPVGSPGLWSSRPDLTTLFPEAQYSGVNFAQGVYTFDASALGDGVHTISWTVIDNLGNGAGIGSRYFTVAGSGTGTVVSASGMLAAARADDVLAAPRDRHPITGRRGYDLSAPYRTYTPNGYGTTTIHGEEIDRFELFFATPSSGTELTGHLRVGGELRPLPIGSTLDGRTGLFTWQPGVGFIGAYDLVFVRWRDGRALSRQDVRIVLNPKGSGRVGPQVVIDIPTVGGTNVPPYTQVAQPFIVAGWAADLDAWSNTGIGTLHVWAYPAHGGAPIFLGAAAYGGLRPDVGAVYGDQFTHSGYGLTVRSLPPGHYMLAVFGYSLLRNDFVPAKTVWVSVR